MKSRFLPVVWLLLPFLTLAQTPEVELVSGMTISSSCQVKAQTYLLAGKSDGACEKGSAVILISGENITVDFQYALLDGGQPGQTPNTFCGLGIRIAGNNITLKNARIKGYKIGLIAEDVSALRLENCDLSYNYRPRLHSIREREDFSDWLSYHQNEHDEWLRYGAGIYLKNCQKATVAGCRISGNQNALLMTGCNDGLIYNNAFNFNSGLGIGLYRSSRNRIMHNRLDWNVRGYSHGFYERGQDSAGILVYEQSNENLIAYNSATHSGDGFFLWAGQTTMDTGKGGCNDNWLFGNDFSHAPTNGIEVTFSRNLIQGNLIRDCTYGIWGGYSYETLIQGNLIENCKTAIAIEHGQNDTIRLNLLEGDSTGIYLWARASQPSDWGYAQNRDVRSHRHSIDRNVFKNVRKPLKISASQEVSVNGENLFTGFETLLETPKPNDQFKFLRNDLYGSTALIAKAWQQPALAPQQNLNFSHPDKSPENIYEPLATPIATLREPDSLPGGMITALPTNFPRGRQFIIVDEWGPYDFRRPIARLDTMAGNRYSIVLLGPRGDWKITSMRGVQKISAREGKTPATLTVERAPGSDELFINFEYHGLREFTTVFGETVYPSQPYSFQFQRFEKTFDWQVQFYNAAPADSLQDTIALRRILQQAPVAEKKTKDLWFAWWGKPADAVQEDRFVSVSTTEADLPAGNYRISITSDDGVRFWVDGKCVIRRWNIHEPETDEVVLPLKGRHQFRIEHFDAGGFSTLDFKIRPQ